MLRIAFEINLACTYLQKYENLMNLNPKHKPWKHKIWTH